LVACRNGVVPLPGRPAATHAPRRPERRRGLVEAIGHPAVRAARLCAKERAPARFYTRGVAAGLSAAFALAVTCAALSDMRQSERSRQAGLWTAKLSRLCVPRRPERRLGLIEASGHSQQNSATLNRLSRSTGMVP
jgi:hypothetical protein